MVKVTLDFIPPDADDIAALIINESVSKGGPFVQIERTTAIGVAPNYITRYTTANAASETDWFTIQWENAAGDVGEMSAPWQGGTTSLVQKIIDRVRERDSTLDERVVAQEAEGAIQMLLGDNADPYDPTLSVSYRQLNGLVYLVLARALIVTAITTQAGSIESATMGLVSFRNQTGRKTTVDVASLIDLANKELGIATSFVLQLGDIEDTYSTDFYDHSRLVSGWVNIE